MLLGYARVSSVDQNLDRQLDGIAVERLYQDRTSGKSRQRPGLEECRRNAFQGLPNGRDGERAQSDAGLRVYGGFF